MPAQQTCDSPSPDRRICLNEDFVLFDVKLEHALVEQPVYTNVYIIISCMCAFFSAVCLSVCLSHVCCRLCGCNSQGDGGDQPTFLDVGRSMTWVHCIEVYKWAAKLLSSDAFLVGKHTHYRPCWMNYIACHTGATRTGGLLQREGNLFLQCLVALTDMFVCVKYA